MLAVRDHTGAQLDAAKLFDLDLGGKVFRNAHMRGADLTGAILVGCNFEGADLRYADFSNADCQAANFSAAAFNITKFHGTRLAGALIEGASGSTVPTSEPRLVAQAYHPKSVVLDMER